MAARPYPSFFIYLDVRGEYRWRIEASNGKMLGDSGEGYNNYQDCLNAIYSIQKIGSDGIWQDAAVTQRVKA